MTSGGPTASLTPAGTPPNPPLSSSLPLAGMRGLRSLLRPWGRRSRFGLAFSPAPFFLLRPLRGLLKKRGPLCGPSGLDALRGFPQASLRQEDYGPPGFAPTRHSACGLGEAAPRPRPRHSCPSRLPPYRVGLGAHRARWVEASSTLRGPSRYRPARRRSDPPFGGAVNTLLNVGRQGLAESSGHRQPQAVAAAWRSGRTPGFRMALAVRTNGSRLARIDDVLRAKTPRTLRSDTRVSVR